jgi:hypothetical protein
MDKKVIGEPWFPGLALSTLLNWDHSPICIHGAVLISYAQGELHLFFIKLGFVLE